MEMWFRVYDTNGRYYTDDIVSIRPFFLKYTTKFHRFPSTMQVCKALKKAMGEKYPCNYCKTRYKGFNLETKPRKKRKKK